LQSRCPRAAPNPLCHIKAGSENNQWADGAKVQVTGVLVPECQQPGAATSLSAGLRLRSVGTPPAPMSPANHRF